MEVRKKVGAIIALAVLITPSSYANAAELVFSNGMSWMEDSVQQNNGQLHIDAAGHFSVLDGQSLSIGASSSDTDVVMTESAGSTVQFTIKGAGSTDITIEGSDGSVSLTDRFKADVTRLGDITGDGLVTPADTLFVYQVINGKATVTDTEKKAIDMNGDGVITAADALLVMRTYTQGSSSQSSEPKYIVEWSNVNDAPVLIKALAAQSAIPNEPYEWTVPSGVFADTDEGDTLTYSASLDNGQPLPAWLSFDDSTRTFRGTPGSSETFKVKITAKDQEGETAEELVDFVVAFPVLNQAPQKTSQVIPEQLAIMGMSGEPVNIASLFTDPDDDPLSYTVSSLNSSVASGTMSASMLTIQPTGMGKTQLKITASDGKASADAYIDVHSVELVPGGLIDVNTKVGVPEVRVDLAPYFPDTTDLQLITNGNPATLSGKIVVCSPGAQGTKKLWVLSADHKAVQITINVEAQSGSPFFFSEYLDAGNGRVALEIYNSAQSIVDGYVLEIHQYNTVQQQRSVTPLPLYPTHPGMVNIIIDSTFYDFFDVANAWYYNNEFSLSSLHTFPVAFVLKKGGQVMDVIGDPNGTGSTPIFNRGGTIIRKKGIVSGSQSYQLLGEWDQYPSGTFQFMGRHTTY